MGKWWQFQFPMEKKQCQSLANHGNIMGKWWTSIGIGYELAIPFVAPSHRTALNFGDSLHIEHCLVVVPREAISGQCCSADSMPSQGTSTASSTTKRLAGKQAVHSMQCLRMRRRNQFLPNALRPSGRFPRKQFEHVETGKTDISSHDLTVSAHDNYYKIATFLHSEISTNAALPTSINVELTWINMT